MISVTQRMTAGNLLLDFTAPKYQKIALGTLRPIVGAIFAAVVYLAIAGGMLGIEAGTGTNASSTLAFFAFAGVRRRLLAIEILRDFARKVRKLGLGCVSATCSRYALCQLLYPTAGTRRDQRS